jgi:hypothetical protein
VERKIDRCNWQVNLNQFASSGSFVIVFLVTATLEPCWMIIDDIFISRIPYAYSNPFICSLWQNEKCPSFREEGFSFWSYFLTLLIMAPGTSLLNGIVISFATGEWKSGRLFRREMCITTIVLSFTALFQAFNHKGLLEGKWGHIYHNEAGLPSIPSILYEVLRSLHSNVSMTRQVS